MDADTFGHYQLIELLGRGGMGEVYRAHDTTTDRIVALKVLPAHLAHDDEYKARFRREAHTAAQLTDPHIIPIHRYGEIDGRLYLDMRIVTGTDLAEILEHGPLDPRRAVAIIRQVATALDSAHKAGLVHRDVKPSNVLVTANDFAYLIDFGIARSSTHTAMTSAGQAVGTFAYMAPERFRPGDVDHRADVYALACVLFECLTGAKPFPGDTTEQVMAGHLFAPPPRPTALNPVLSPAFDQVIAVGLAKDPNQRYQSVLQLAEAAQHALATPPANVPPPPGQPIPRSRPPAPPTQGSTPTLHAAVPQQRPGFHIEQRSAPPGHQPPPVPPPPFPSTPRRANRHPAFIAAGVVAVALVVALAVWQLWPTPSGDNRPESSGDRPAGTSASGSVSIGIKFDQPGLGLKNPDGSFSGFDVDVATFVAEQQGYDADQITWKEAPAAQRENLIANGQVDYVVATYSITDARREKITFAGPYLVTGQSLLVRADNTDITGRESLAGKKLCSVTGSTPAQRIKDEVPGVQLQQYDTYSACIEALRNGAVDAVTTDELILAGFAAESPGTFKLVGEPFSVENYGVGLKKGDTELCNQITDALKKMESDGAWKAAWEKNFGPAGLAAPAPPAPEAC